MRILSFSSSHDSSVSCLNNGKLEFFCKEERISRIKRDGSPFSSLELFSKHFTNPDHAIFITPSNYQNSENNYPAYIFKKFNLDLENFSHNQHHIFHAVLAFFNSGFEESIVLVVDRNGCIIFSDDLITPLARENESVYYFSRNSLKSLYKSFSTFNNLTTKRYFIKSLVNKIFPDTDIMLSNFYGITKVYEAATTLIGQNVLENGKTMGLSSYGRNMDFPNLFDKGYPIDHYFTQIHGMSEPVCFYGLEDKITNEVTKENYQFYADKAKQVQIQTQEECLSLLKKYSNESKNVCVVGGYGLNIISNAFYKKHLPNHNFYFEPVADDTGVSIGASILKHLQLKGNISYETPKNNFYHFFDSNEPLEGGKECNIDELVDLLVNQKIIALFEGQPEAGPRALGHRSILFDPRNPNAKEIVNKVKKREWYRPFAGIILEEEFKNYFYDIGLDNSKYMTVNFECKSITKQIVPGIVHVDGTCRIQTVSEGFIYALLKKFHQKTGCPMILNTSFNLAGQPLVQTYKDALETLHNSHIDGVYFVDLNKLFV